MVGMRGTGGQPVSKRFVLSNKWFFEDPALLGEPATTIWGVLPQRVVYSGRTRFQQVDIFDTREHGRILALDGLVQLSTKHEFVYHEMLVHPAVLYASNPRNALIIGGGDGGALREMVKHPFEKILLVDIDREVVELCRKYFPSLSDGAFRDERVSLLCEDAFLTLRRFRDSFDIIVSDCTDSYGPSKALWSKKFYGSILQALRPRGVVSFQTGYFKEKYARKSRRQIREVFPFSRVHRAFVGCYPFDECTFTVASANIDFEKMGLPPLKRKFSQRDLKTRYYSPAMHAASAVIPSFQGEA